MSPGKYYRVGRIGDNSISVKLVCFGIVPGKIIQVIRKAPLGGAYYISCDDKRVGISSNEISKLDLKEVMIEENGLI
jgi:Fe2+ transport system protein FeoA